MPERNITFEIKEHLGVITQYDSGWSKELNVISWNGGTPKFDVRDWDPHHERMSRGLTLHPGEMRKLVDLYVASNNRNAVERGRAIEAERKARREEARRNREEQQEVSEFSAEQSAMEMAEQEAFENTIKPTEDAADAVCEAEEAPPFVPDTPAESTETKEDSF